MALFSWRTAKIRNEVDENANIIFGSSIDYDLEGIIKVSVVATGINKEEINDFQDDIFDDEMRSNKIILNSVSENYDHNSETTFIKKLLKYGRWKYWSNWFRDRNKQIGSLPENIQKVNESYLDTKINKDELENIFKNKPENKFTQSKPNLC